MNNSFNAKKKNAKDHSAEGVITNITKISLVKSLRRKREKNRMIKISFNLPKRISSRNALTATSMSKRLQVVIIWFAIRSNAKGRRPFVTNVERNGRKNPMVLKADINNINSI